MKINIQNLSFGRWISICNLLHCSNVIKECKRKRTLCMLFNNSEDVFSEYHFYSENQTFNSLPLIDVLLFLRSLTGHFWVKVYYIRALKNLAGKRELHAKQFMSLALNYYISKVEKGSTEYYSAYIARESLINGY